MLPGPLCRSPRCRARRATAGAAACLQLAEVRRRARHSAEDVPQLAGRRPKLAREQGHQRGLACARSGMRSPRPLDCNGDTAVASTRRGRVRHPVGAACGRSAAEPKEAAGSNVPRSGVPHPLGPMRA
eukprot:4566073-Prymnesium_polylepis.1